MSVIILLASESPIYFENEEGYGSLTAVVG
jgi:hypothetical protein